MRVSVLIPTYKRLFFLKKAVDDVLAQSFADWELVISDDEVGDGETWRWLQDLAARMPKVRVVKNKGPRHGQVWNVNNGLRECHGDWVKPFYDDDRMHPDCLEKMMTVASKHPSVVMVGCRAQKWRAGKYVGDEKDFCHGEIDLIAQRDCLQALCRYDRWNGRTPQHMLIRRSAIEQGAYMPEDCCYKMPVDNVWFARILKVGDYAMIRDVLVEQHEGEIGSLTGIVRSDETMIDAELFLAYHDIFDMMSKEERRGLTWREVEMQINGARGVYHIKCGRFKYGIKTMLKMFKSTRAPFMVLRWLLQETFPGHFSATKRV